MDVKKELELLREYDAETGEETDNSVGKIANFVEATHIQEGEAYEVMISTPGWKHFEARLREVIADNLEVLVDCEDEAKLRQAQAVVKVYRGVLAEVYSTISQAQSLREAPIAQMDNAH